MTVIEDRVHRSSVRNAKLAFILTAVIVAVLAITVASSYMHPVLGLLLGLFLGAAVGALVGAVVLIWPVLRVIWWWTTEISLAIGVVYGWVALATHTSLVVRLAVVAVLLGVPAAVGPIRRRIVAVAWCVIVRHRLRVCFAQFIIANRSGSLPLILWARPTPVGERVWIYLRPGLSAKDLEARLDKMAVACWASTVTVERASTTNAAYLRVDIKRRQVLTATVGSPLVDMVDPDDLGIPRTRRPATTATVGGLDLPDVPADTPTASAPRPSPRPHPAPAAAAATRADGEDISDWI
ncbi:hypothetical protein [Phytohabitans rumicis]|uniref:hypothetical protein n=1 Tax=Phytohabitans rumicis TaxID=1076125 RepID=UPI001564944F|nr:hypothetical protein [Phytohabitans rumicis]